MGKKGKKAQAGKPKKLTPKDVGKRLNTLAKNLEEELEGAELFVPLPPMEDCAICLVPIGINTEKMYHACCGNTICFACYGENEEAIKKQNEEKSAGKKLAFTCPFCREPKPTGDYGAIDRAYLRQIQARCLLNDHVALTLMGNRYRDVDGLRKDDLKALDCWIRAVELGSAVACGSIAGCYKEGNGVSANTEKSALFERVGALRGDVCARHSIGWDEYCTFGNYEIGIRHWKIAAEAGYEKSLFWLKNTYNADGKLPGKEFISKEELDTISRSGHEAQMEVTSEEREKLKTVGALLTYM